MIQVIHHPKLDAYGDRISVLPMQPLKVTLQTIKPIAHTDPLHLDGILAWAMVLEAMEGDLLPKSNDAYWMPLPLEIEALIDGLPLWKSTDFRTEGEIGATATQIAMTHHHQRSDANPYAMAAQLPNPKKRRQPPTTEGQYMSYRRPVQYEAADEWTATCVGSLEECDRLLNTYVHQVGKEGSRGFGRVLNWLIEPADGFMMQVRPIPLRSPDQLLESGSASLTGWTPPYWHRALWRMCTF